MSTRLLAFAHAAILAPALMTAQVSYLFNHDIALQPYQNISGAVPLTSWGADGWRAIHDLPAQSVWAFGAVYDLGTLSIHRDGVVRLTNDESTVYFGLTGTGLEPIDASSSIGYKLLTTANGATLVVQLRDMRLTNGLADNYMNAQLWIALETGHVFVHFGPRSDSNGGGFTNDSGPHIGLRKQLAEGGACVERIWPFGDPDSPQVAYDGQCEMPSLLGVPVPGTMYRYEPTFFTPNGIAELDAPAISLSPTIAEETIQVSSGAASAVQATLRATDGRVVRQLRLMPGTNTIGVGDLPAGAYLLHSDGHAAIRFLKS